MKEEVNSIVFKYKQTLGQNSFHVFHELKELVSSSDAKKIVVNELDKVKGQFSSDPSLQLDFLTDIEKELNKEIVDANKNKSYDRVLEIEDDLTSIQRVRGLMQQINEKEGS